MTAPSEVTAPLTRPQLVAPLFDLAPSTPPSGTHLVRPRTGGRHRRGRTSWRLRWALRRWRT